MVGASQGVAFDYSRIGLSCAGGTSVWGSGGSVSIDLPASTAITTSGTGSHGGPEPGHHQ